jgi:hypothetical protein
MGDARSLLLQIEAHLDTLEMIQFAGGEPLAADEHYWLLERIIERGLFHIRLVYNTNLSTLRYKGRDILELWDRFESVNVWASFDALGRRAEYLRKGQDWGAAIRNCKRMLRHSLRINFGLAPTVSLFNALHLPDLLKEMIGSGYVAERSLHLNMLAHPVCYSIQALPPAFKRAVIDKYQEQKWPEGMKTVAPLLESVVAYMMADDLSSHLDDFRMWTHKLDCLRREDLRKVFPELAELL